MSYHEKRALVSTAGGIVLIAVYCIYAFGKLQAGTIMPGDLKFWAVTMLVFIAVGVVGMIAIQIIFHILYAISVAGKEAYEKGGRPSDEEIDRAVQTTFVDDEMVKLIELKAARIGSAVAGAGLVAGLVTLALGSMPAVMLNVAFFSCAAGCLIEGVASIAFFRKGVGHA